MSLKLYKNFLNSINGIRYVIKESSFILELILGIFLVTYLFLFEFSFILKIVLFFNYILILSSEIFNTAIEKICNKINPNYDEDIKIIKDLSSAAVFLLIISLIILFLFTI